MIVFQCPDGVIHMHVNVGVYTDFRFLMHGRSLQMLDSSQTLLPADQLEKRLEQEGENLYPNLIIVSPHVGHFKRH